MLAEPGIVEQGITVHGGYACSECGVRGQLGNLRVPSGTLAATERETLARRVHGRSSCVQTVSAHFHGFHVAVLDGHVQARAFAAAGWGERRPALRVYLLSRACKAFLLSTVRCRRPEVKVLEAWCGCCSWHFDTSVCVCLVRGRGMVE